MHGLEVSKARRRWGRWIGLSVLALLVLSTPILYRLAYHFVPASWTGEAARLAEVLALAPGKHVAEIGAGTGWLAVEIAAHVGPSGRVYATELPDQLEGLRTAVSASGLPQLEAVPAAEEATGLPAQCCDALYMRQVAHHISALDPYAAEIRKTLRPGGRVAIIDFLPGALFYLAGDHGIEREVVAAAFAAHGFVLEREVERWGGGMYLVAFRLEFPERSSSGLDVSQAPQPLEVLLREHEIARAKAIVLGPPLPHFPRPVDRLSRW